MKIQCGVCEKAEGTLFCCADQAVLCHSCDEKVHAANKLASRHYRAALLNTSSSSMAKCDICQDSAAYIFCLEDRALYCRMCDVAIHNINDLVKAHQRYLLTGIKVGLEVASGSSSSGGISHSGEKISDAENRETEKRSAPASTRSQHGKARFNQRSDAAMPSKKFFPNPAAYEFPQMQPVQYGTFGDITQTGMANYGGSAAAPLTPWLIDDFLALTGFPFMDGLPDNASSKADDNSGKSGDDSSYQRSIKDDVDSDDQLGQVPDVSWTVPQVPSPPTASGLYWPKTSQELVDNAVSVPDICWSQATNYHQ